ncbi:MAG: anthranilate synthase component II [Spirochaetia bacterium]
MKTLLIDNNDSFTYNIVELLRKVSGDRPTVVLAENLALEEAGCYDRIIFSPGPGLPDEFPIMHKVLDRYAGKLPILGICLGHQAVCTFYGGKLINPGKVIHGQPRFLSISAPSRLLATEGQAQAKGDRPRAGLYNSWVADPDSLPEQLRVTAVSEDRIIMAVEHREHPVFGVQFHPESYITNCGEMIMERFLCI